VDPVELGLWFLGSPAPWAIVALFVALGFGLWVRRQLRAMGLVELEDRIRWSRGVTALAVLLALTLLEAVVTHQFGMVREAGWLGAAFTRALSLVPAMLLLSGAGWYSVHRRGTAAEVSPGVASELRWVQLGAGLLAALSVVQAPMVPLLGALLLGGAAWWYTTTPGASDKLKHWQQDFHTGSRLRDRLDADATVDLDGEEVSVIGKAGLLETDVLTPDGMKTVSNRRLMQAAAARLKT